MLQLFEETQIVLNQALKNPSLYTTKIKGTKRFEDKGHNFVTCAIITFTNDNEEKMASNFTIIVLKPRHSNDIP